MTRYPEKTEVPVVIPTPDGKGVAETIMITVPCRIDAKSGEAILGGEALRMIDKVKARHMGLMLPDEIRMLRSHLRLSQSDMSELLQIGAKSYTRWESGRERPSRSINILLRSLWDGKIDVGYLRSVKDSKFNWWPTIQGPVYGIKPRPYTLIVTTAEDKCHATEQFAA